MVIQAALQLFTYNTMANVVPETAKPVLGQGTQHRRFEEEVPDHFGENKKWL